MIENSAAGLVMVPGEVTVTVTGEEHHQDALARYAVPDGVTRHVAVHLTWCMIAAGRYRGQRGIEVRLDGQRVGELTFLMSQRYAPVLMHVESGGGSTGCAALVQRGTNGLLQIVLRMPREIPRGAVVPVASKRRSRVRPVVIGAASLFAIGLIGAALDGPSATSSGSALTTTASPTTTTTTVAPTSTTTTSTTTTTTTPPAVAQPKPQPQPQPQPQPKPQPKPQPQPAPAPQPSCHASYSPCVPIASDVDCAGGSGNGPAYVTGPIRVIGPDVYDLDRDGNGVACE